MTSPFCQRLKTASKQFIELVCCRTISAGIPMLNEQDTEVLRYIFEYVISYNSYPDNPTVEMWLYIADRAHRAEKTVRDDCGRCYTHLANITGRDRNRVKSNAILSIACQLFHDDLAATLKGVLIDEEKLTLFHDKENSALGQFLLPYIKTDFK